MSFLRRLGYFLLGVTLGSMLVYVLLIRDREFPAWLPEDRVIEELAVDSIIIGNGLELPFADSVLIDKIEASDVLFRESIVRDAPCKEYQLESDAERMRFEICQKQITLIRFEKRPVN
jgi:hypothetical protein